MNIAQADIVFLRYTYTWYLLPNTAEMCCQNWLYRTCGTSLPRSATTLRRNSSSVTGKTTMCICLSIIRPKYPSLSWSTVSRVYPVAVCEAFALKLRVGIAKVSFGRRLILPLHVVVRRSILSANMSKRSEPTKNRASAVAPYIPGQTHEIFIQENYGINSPNTGDKRGEFVKSIPDQSPIGIFWPYRPSVQGIGAFMRLPCLISPP